MPPTPTPDAPPSAAPFRERCADRPTDRSNQLRILAWTIAWMGSWLAVNLAVRYELLATGPFATGLAALTGLLGLGVVWTYLRFLRHTDELRRKIELEALSLAFGVGLVGALTYWLLGRTGGLAEVDLLDVWVVMMVTYSLAVLAGLRRYSR